MLYLIVQRIHRETFSESRIDSPNEYLNSGHRIQDCTGSAGREDLPATRSKSRRLDLGIGSSARCRGDAYPRSSSPHREALPVQTRSCQADAPGRSTRNRHASARRSRTGSDRGQPSEAGHPPPHDGPYMTINGVKFPAGHIEPEHGLLMIQLWKRSGVWPQTLGPPPGRVGCGCPGDILQVAGCDVRAA
jgi:hypothetical protein